jgi:hypothetical protein
MIKPGAATLRIFVGYDSTEIVAYHAFCQSVIERASRPVSFTPIALTHLDGVFERPRNSLQSTEFSFSRFLTPHLSNYEGWSLFVDCDFIALDDIAKLFDLADDRFAAMVCKHDYTPVSDRKFAGNVQTKYEKKNWSSLVLFNNARCRALTPHYVSTASGLELHQFKWLSSARFRSNGTGSSANTRTTQTRAWSTTRSAVHTSRSIAIATTPRSGSPRATR